jgi:trans-aconitate 2-methyltransferase
MKSVAYTYGTNSAAASRLEEIAKYFNPRAANFLRQHIPGVPGIGIDLGCGPGFTTNMLAEATGCPRIYGFDNSPTFHFLMAYKNKPLLKKPPDNQ